jgi:hypothetical protein
MPDQAPNIDVKPGDKGRLVYDKARRAIVTAQPATSQTVPMTFDEWFLKVSSWGLTYDQLVTCSLTTLGTDPGDTVYTSPSGSEMTRHICSHWINFYGAAQFGWKASRAYPAAELQATYNDLLALQDQTNHIPLSQALDVVGGALAALSRS